MSAKKIKTEKSRKTKKKSEAPEKPKAKLLRKKSSAPAPAPAPVAPAVAEKPLKKKKVTKVAKAAKAAREKVSPAAEKKPAAKKATKATKKATRKTSVKAQAEKPAAAPRSGLKVKAEAKPVAAPAKVVQVVQRASLASLFGAPVSSSEKVVFSEEPPEWVKPEWVKYYKNLYMLHKRLKNQMLGFAEDSAQEISSFGMHMADAGTDHFDRDFALSQLSADRDSIHEVEQALKRIQNGSYGICEMTGKQIPKNRLEAIPWTRYTVEAQAIIEKEGGKSRRRLADLGNLTAASGDESESRSSAEEEDEGEDKLA